MLVQGNVQPLTFLICTFRTSGAASRILRGLCYTALSDGPSDNLVQLLRPLYVNRVSSTRKLYQLSLGHVCLDKLASSRVHEVILIPGHNNHLENTPRNFPQPILADPVCESCSHLRNNANERLRSSGVVSPQEFLERWLTRVSLCKKKKKVSAPTDLGLYFSIRPTAGVSFRLGFQPFRREQYSQRFRYPRIWIFDQQQPKWLSDSSYTRILANRAPC